MARVPIREDVSQKIRSRNYSFTVVFKPGGPPSASSANGTRKGGRSKLVDSEYQVTVPLLPGLITYGRNLEEAREMARDAIRCHVEGLLRDMKVAQS
jgi:hypothetical protein